MRCHWPSFCCFCLRATSSGSTGPLNPRGELRGTRRVFRKPLNKTRDASSIRKPERSSVDGIIVTKKQILVQSPKTCAVLPLNWASMANAPPR